MRRTASHCVFRRFGLKLERNGAILQDLASALLHFCDPTISRENRSLFICKIMPNSTRRRRFSLTVYRLSGDPVTVPGCHRRMYVDDLCQAIKEASHHLLPDRYSRSMCNASLIVGFARAPCNKDLRLYQANIDQFTLLSVVFEEIEIVSETEYSDW